MLSISPPMSPGQGLTSYFTGAEDYYLSSPGQWQGKGAVMLGLGGEVTREQFRLISNGFHPGTGELLVPGKEVTDPVTGKSKTKKQAGNDLTFSAGKSISVATVVDPQIKSLHERAVAKVIDYIEKNNMQARQQIAGKREIVDTGNLTIAKFSHMTSRALDPQLHTHAFLFNLTQRPDDGRWRALHNKSIFRDKMALGKLYRSELYRELRQAGYDLELTDRIEGFYRIKGVPTALEEHFSQRRKQIEAKVNDPKFKTKYKNADKATLYQIAALGTRARKQQISAKEIKNHWRKEVEGQGYTLDQIKIGIEKSKSFHNIEPQKSPEAIIDQAIEAITETDSVFRKTQILEVAATLAFGQHTIADLDQAFRSATKTNIIPMGRQNGRQYYTSREMLKIEKSAIDAAKAGRGKRQPLASKQEVADTISAAEQKNGWRYTSGQKAAITALATAKDRVILIQGDAGTGKTASMSIFNQLAKSKGYTVRGLGFTGKSASELEQGAGIKSQTIDSFLLEQNNSNSAGESEEIWLVDESSMAGSRHYKAILDRAQEQDATVVFLGDRKQFQSIAAGRMFQDLQQAIGTHAELTEVMRQKTPETKAVVASLNRDKYNEAFNKLEKQGNLKVYQSKNDLQRAAVQHYRNAVKQGKKSAVVATASNADRQDLNRKIKAELVRSGLVEPGTDHTVLTSHNVPAARAGLASSYKEDQVVQIHKSVPGLRAGQSGRVVGIDHDRNTITVQAGKKHHDIDVGKYHSRLAFFTEQSINVSKNDKIIFTKNDKKLGIKNGQIGSVKAIDLTGNVSVTVGKKTVKFSLSEFKQKQADAAKYTYRHIDHAYAITAHKSQGATFDNVIWHTPTKKGKDWQIDKRSAYVAATRAKESFVVLTDSKKKLLSAVSRERGKGSIAEISEEFERSSRLHKLKKMVKEAEQEARSHKPKVNLGMSAGMGK